METLNKIADNLMELTFLVGAIFFFLSLITYRFPPKKINTYYGYRTPNSMKNQKSWNFAQQFSCYRMAEGGLFLILFSFLKTAIPISKDVELIIGFVAIFVVIVYLIISTEKALKKNFPNDK